jgi:hypothetical protein
MDGPKGSTMALRTLLPSDWGSKDVWRAVLTVSLFLERSEGVSRLFEDLQEKKMKDLIKFCPVGVLPG